MLALLVLALVAVVASQVEQRPLFFPLPSLFLTTRPSGLLSAHRLSSAQCSSSSSCSSAPPRRPSFVRRLNSGLRSFASRSRALGQRFLSGARNLASRAGQTAGAFGRSVRQILRGRSAAPPSSAPSVRQILRGDAAPQIPRAPTSDRSVAPQIRSVPTSDRSVAPQISSAPLPGLRGRPVDIGRLSTLQEARRLPNGGLGFRAGATIDVDGSGPSHGDPDKQWQTSLSTRDGKALNADAVPFFVLPPQVARQFNVRPGDVGVISYKGRRTPAVFGDVGPRSRIGEISKASAEALGIDSSPTRGGVPSGVEFQVFPGSGSRRPTEEDLTPEALQRRVDEYLASHPDQE